MASERLYNPIATVHGGYIATLLDSAMASAVHTTLAKGQAYTTIEIKIEFIRAVTDKTGPIRATEKLINANRRVGVADGTLTDAGGRILPHGTTTCLIFPFEARSSCSSLPIVQLAKRKVECVIDRLEPQLRATGVAVFTS